MDKTFIRWIIIAILFCGSAIDVMAADIASVEKWLNDYDNSQGETQIQLGNQLLQVFYEEKLTDTSIKLNPQSNQNSRNHQVWYWASEYFYSHQSYSNALTYGLKALPLCENDEDKANCLSLLSLIYFRQSNYEKAAEYAKQCYKLDEKSGDPDVMSSSLNTLAGIYIGANQPKEAEQYILKGIEMAKKADNPARMAVLHGMASEVYHALENDQEALKYIDEAINIEQQLGNEYKKMVRLSQKASVLIGLHRYNEAEQLLNQVIPVFEKSGDKQSLAIAYNKKGMVMASYEKNQEASACFHKAADLFMEMGDKRNEMHARRGLYENLWHSNPDSARIELERFNALKDSLYNLASAESLARYNAEFGSDWLQHENELQKAKTQKIIIIGGVLLVILICGVWLLMRRRLHLRTAALQAIINELQPRDEQIEEPKQEQLERDELSVADQELLSRLVSTVKEDMSQGGLTIEQIASKLCITRGQLNRRIKAITGVTTQQYVLRIRLEHARLLLDEKSQMSISEIAYKCGFDDATSFSRAFRRTFSKSPSQYRQECQNEG